MSEQSSNVYKQNQEQPSVQNSYSPNLSGQDATNYSAQNNLQHCQYQNYIQTYSYFHQPHFASLNYQYYMHNRAHFYPNCFTSQQQYYGWNSTQALQATQHTFYPGNYNQNFSATKYNYDHGNYDQNQFAQQDKINDGKYDENENSKVCEEEGFAVTQYIGNQLQEPKVKYEKNFLNDGLSKVAEQWVSSLSGQKFQNEGENSGQYQQQCQAVEENRESHNKPQPYNVSRQQAREFVRQVRGLLQYTNQSYCLDNEGEEELLGLTKSDYKRVLWDLRRHIQNLYNATI
eukprot:TRINITY_DN1846_c0_g1_i1.p1 TRINITY_DN1846_c0_g1~~TRINITY_DN1846_c0_g1_i1.p1  ORF type:complete len:288 (-),score=19.10 TRINITY_DN1846_c0_g1_i1:363-1226(-)